jgi:hypothetical protein
MPRRLIAAACCVHPEAPHQLLPQVVRRHHRVDDQLGCEAEDVDVLAVLVLQSSDESRALILGQLLDAVVVDGVDRRLRTHHRDLRRWQRQRCVRFERRAVHRVEPGAVRLAQHHADLRHRCLRESRDHLCAMTDDALAFDSGADHEPGHVGQEEQRDVERITARDEARRLVRGVDEQHAALESRLRGEHADGAPVDARQPGDDLARVQMLDLEERAVVDEPADDRHHVVAARGLIRDDPVDVRGLRVDASCLDLLGCLPPRLRHVRQVGPRGLDALLLVLHEHVTTAADRAMHARPAHLLKRHLLAHHDLGHAG